MAGMLMWKFDGFPASLPQIIQLCTPCSATANRLYIHDIRAMQRKDSFHTFAAYHTPHREGFVDSAASAGDYCSGEYLDTLLIAFPDPAVHVNGIADFEVRYIVF